jgi:hypothetical protein
MIRLMPRITREVGSCHVGPRIVPLAAILLGVAVPGRGETLSELLASVAAHARFASPARADVQIECAGGCAGGRAIFVGRDDALYVEVKDGQRALLRPGRSVVLEGGKAVDAPGGKSFAGTDILLEDLVPFAAASLRMPQISDDGPAGVVVTAAPAAASTYSLLVHTIDRDRQAIVRTLYYRDVVNNLAKTRRDGALARVAGGWRPGEVVVETLRQATRTRLALSWREAPDAPAALFEPAGLERPSGLTWP